MLANETKKETNREAKKTKTSGAGRSAATRRVTGLGATVEFAVAVLLSSMLASAASAQVGLELAFQGPSRPTGIHFANDGQRRIFVLSKNGTISIYDRGSNTLLPTPFLDIDPIVNSSGVERGLHGLAFHPDYANNGFFYVVYTNLASDSIIARYSVSAADPNVADPTSELVLLEIDQPDQYHNVSQLQFGPDGYLYIGAGDGGFIGDPNNNAQNLGELLGKILRIDVDGALPYAIPADNPFVGVPGAREEIWAYGVRNPWRFTFDRQTGDMWIGDVGQWSWEEVSFQPASSTGGENYGWRLMEGAHCYNPTSGCDTGALVYPTFEFPHSGGQCAVIGGFRYRGTRFPSLQGAYFYADWCTGNIWKATETTPGTWSVELVLDAGFSITTFGEDEDGELFIANDDNGQIYRIVGPDPFCDVEMSQNVYTDGETWTFSSVRLVNLGAAAVPAQFRLGLKPPGSSPIFFVNVGAGGGFSLPAGLNLQLGPIPLLTVGPTTPRASFNALCVVNDPTSGAILSLDRAPFTVE